MHHLRYDGTYRLSLFMELSQGVDVSYVMPCMLPGHVSQGPFHSYGVRRHILSTEREMMYPTKTNIQRSYFRFASPPTTESPGHDHSNNSPPPGPKGWNFPVVARGVVTSLIELCINDILENQKPLFPG